MKTRNLYSVESIYDWGAIYPNIDLFTNEKAALEAGKFFFNDGAQSVRVIKHVKSGTTTLSRKEILRLESPVEGGAR